MATIHDSDARRRAAALGLRILDGGGGQHEAQPRFEPARRTVYTPPAERR